MIERVDILLSKQTAARKRKRRACHYEGEKKKAGVLARLPSICKIKLDCNKFHVYLESDMYANVTPSRWLSQNYKIIKIGLALSVFNKSITWAFIGWFFELPFILILLYIYIHIVCFLIGCVGKNKIYFQRTTKTLWIPQFTCNPYGMEPCDCPQHNPQHFCPSGHNGPGIFSSLECQWCTSMLAEATLVVEVTVAAADFSEIKKQLHHSNWHYRFRFDYCWIFRLNL